jgi:hypothetical protein
MKEATDRLNDHMAVRELRRLRGEAHPERSRLDDPLARFALDLDLNEEGPTGQ